MFYVLHNDRVVCAAIEFTPYQPDRWPVGQIIHFSTAYAALAREIDYAILMSMSGEAWHLEVLAVTFPRRTGAAAHSGVTVRILRKLKGDDECLAMIHDYVSRMSRYAGKTEVLLAAQPGAA